MVIEKSLAGPIGIFVKFSTLQDHGVDKVFFLENDNVDASQKNVIFLARGEKANQPIAIAGMYVLLLSRFLMHVGSLSISSAKPFPHCELYILPISQTRDLQVDYVDSFLLYIVSLDPKIKSISYPARSIAFPCACNRYYAIITC